MTPLEQNTYNCYIATSRKMQNKPFRLRNNWDGFESDKNYPYVVKLANLFEKFNMASQTEIEKFFIAPFMIYGCDDWFDLKWYCSQKAISCYAKYKKKLEMSVDSLLTIKHVKKSLIFIGQYCFDNNIKLSNYIKHTEENSCLPVFIKHLKNNDVSIYCLFYFNDFESIVFKMNEEEREVILGHISSNFREYKMLYWNSNKIRDIIVRGMKLIEDNL